jgi:hypothetical protein
VIAYKSEVIAPAPFNGLRQRRATHDCATPSHTWQVFGRLELTHKCVFVFLSYLRFELEEDYVLRVLVDKTHN